MNEALLPDLVKKAESAVTVHRSRRESSQIVQALQTRLDDLHPPAKQLADLRRTADLLQPRGLPRLMRPTVTRLQKIGPRLAKVRDSLKANVDSIVQPNSLPLNDLDDVCGRINQELSEFWKTYVTNALPNESVLATFEKHASWMPIVRRLRELKKSLQDSATRLPQTPDDLAVVERQVAAAQREFEQLPDLSEKKKLFLRRSVEPGVTLAELLADADLLAWIKEQGLDQNLRVVSR